MWRCMPMMMIAWMLTGCASGPTPIPTRLPPPNLTTPCPGLSAPASARPGDLLANHVATARLYHDCKARQRALAAWALNPGPTGGGHE